MSIFAWAPTCTSPRPSARRGFTLVELLVVVSVIAVIISLLIPAARSAREAAKRAVCLSNLRQQGIAASEYSSAYKEVIPVGWTAYKQFNYMGFHNDGGPPDVQPICWGLLVSAGFLPVPQSFYCPSVTSPGIMFNSPINVCKTWPPLPSSSNVRIAYGVRPEIEFAKPGKDWVPITGSKWPRRPSLENKALSCDRLNSSGAMMFCHLAGANVLYENGSARWVSDKVINSAGLTSITGTSGPAYNNAIDTIWKALDKN